MIAAKEHNLETALKLAASGLSVFPCFAGGEQAKRPMPFIKWRDVSTTDVMQIKQWWAKWPGAAIGLDLAKCGFVVIDCDRHDADADGVEAFGQLAAAHSHDIDASPLVATPKEGSHVYFRQPDGKSYGNARGTLPAGVDVRGAGGYVIAPGTVMEDGRAYELFGNLSAAPVLPQWVADIIDTGEEQPKAQPVPVPREAHSDARVNAYCEAAISAEISKVENAAKGGRNNTLNEAAFALGQLVGAGWKSEAEIAGLLMNAAAACGLNPVESRKTIQSGIRAGAKEPRQLPPSEGPELEAPEELARINAMILAAWERQQREKEGTRQIVEQQDGTIADAETGEIIEVASDEDENIGGALDYFDLPDDQVTPPGLVGRIADWIYETAGDPIKVHAVGAALVIVGTLMGRKVFSKSRPTGTNLYIGALAPSGYGKDHPRVCMQLILDEFTNKQGHPLHISMLPKSDSKLASTIYDRPASVMIVDEFAAKLAHTKGKNASSSAASITEVFLEMWGKGQSNYEVPSALTRSEQEIKRPSLSFYGASTIKVFAETLISKDVTSGLYNRFLFLPHYGEVVSRPEIDGTLSVPERILAECGWLYECLDYHQMALSRVSDSYPPEPVLIPFSDEAAQVNEENRAFQKKMQRLIDEDSALALYGRYAEQIKRIAMIVACGRSTEFVSRAIIEASDMEFAKRLVSWSIGQAVLMVRRDMVENWIDANRKKVISIIRSKKSLKRAALIRMTSGIKGRDLDEIINYLKQAECIEELSIKTPGRPAIVYKYVKG